MEYCMNNEELEALLSSQIEGQVIEDSDLNSQVENALLWHNKLLCLTFSLARILERNKNSIPLVQQMIPKMFTMPDRMFIEIQECGEDFVDYMLRNEHVGEETLEESLQMIERNFEMKCYGKNTLRD